MKKLFFVAAGMIAVALGFNSCGNNKCPQVKLNNEIDSAAYAWALFQGKNYASVADSNTLIPDEQVNIDVVLAAFELAARRDTDHLQMSEAEAQEFMEQFSKKIQAKMEAKRAEEEAKRQAQCEENKTKGADYMAENAKKEGVVTLESGLQLQTLVAGNGKQPKEGDKVKVNYKGSLIDGNVFDQNEGAEFSTNGVVKGFKEALLNMKVGSKVVATMPSNLAYGDRGAGQNIPGGATLIFEIELLEIVK